MTTWRDARNSNGPQRRFLDAMLMLGDYSYLRDNKVTRPKALMGGAGYGGKSYGLRTATGEINGYFRSIGLPDRWGCLMCKKYTDLAGRQVKKLQQEMSHVGRVRSTRLHGLLFEFYEEGMGGFYLRNAQDPDGAKGTEYDWLLIDELTQFERGEFDAIDYLLRSPDQPFVPFGAGTNPDGIGHDWVKRWWIEGDLSEFAQLIKEGLVHPSEYQFIPAKPWDNPTYGPSVEARLRGFDDPMLVQSRFHGSWELAGGMRFSQYNRSVHSFTDEDLFLAYGWLNPAATTIEQLLCDPEIFACYASLDYGTDADGASAFYIHFVSYEEPSTVWTFDEYYLQGRFLHEQAETFKKAIAQYKGNFVRIYADPSLKGKADEGVSRLAKFRQEGLSMVPAINDRVEGWGTLDSFLAYSLDDNGDYVRKPRWRIHERCVNLHRALASAPRDSVKLEDVSKAFKKDHALDSVRYFLHSHFGGATRSAQRPSVLTGAGIRERRKEETRRKRASAGFW